MADGACRRPRIAFVLFMGASGRVLLLNGFLGTEIFGSCLGYGWIFGLSSADFSIEYGVSSR